MTEHIGRPQRGERIVTALSGGVDSSVAALLLVQAGFDVVGVTLQLQPCDEAQIAEACCGTEAIAAAQAAAAKLGIPHQILDGRRDFEDLVLRPAWDEYARGRTPNPCLVCNERIKFGVLLDRARELGARRIATGHYARIEFDTAGAPILLRGVDPSKDQAYFLAGLSHQQLLHSIFPLGQLRKSEVRALAEQHELPNARRTESQDACLITPGDNFAEVLRLRFGGQAVSGNIVDVEGNVLSDHHGLHQFTIGQRKGLGGGFARRTWVKAIDRNTGNVIITDQAQNLNSRSLLASGMNWIAPPVAGAPTECQVQTRYRQAAVDARFECDPSGAVRVTFHQPLRAVAPGQAAVLFRGDLVLGRGWIDAAE